MPTFDTPAPITVDVDVVGNVRITASDRPDTVVAVVPMRPGRSADERAAAETVVEFANGRLSVRTPKRWTRFTPRGGGDSVEVAIELPTGSMIDARTGFGDIRCEGELGECRLKSGMGAVRVDHATSANATTGFGDVAIDHVVGDLEATTGSGHVRVGEVGGSITVKNSNGDTSIGSAGGAVEAKASNGDIGIGWAGSSVTARSSCGAVRVAAVNGGRVELQTSAGDLEVGVTEGVAAWLDVSSSFGTMRNDLDAVDGPGGADRTVEIRGRTGAGNIVIRRAAAESSRSAS